MNDYDEYDDRRSSSTRKGLVKKLVAGAAIAVAFVGVSSTWFTTSEGHIYFVQDKVTKSTRVINGAGIHFKFPFFTNVYEYKQLVTIDMTPSNIAATRDLNPLSVKFADTYSGSVPLGFRFRLPTDEPKFRYLHNEFRGFENLVDSLLVANAQSVSNITATQYTGEEFFQGGVNQFKVQLEDQLRNGVYVTKRERVKVEDEAFAPVSSKNSDSRKVEKVQRFVTKNVIQRDPETGESMRLPNALTDYGVVTTQVTIGNPVADDQLQTLLKTKRDLVGKKIAAQQSIETSWTEAEAEKQKRTIEQQREIQIANKDKELAIIAEQRETAVETERAEKERVRKEKEKEIAKLEKEKELEIAQANLEIQQANAKAAEFEAQAVRELGLAQAEVENAKLQAKQNARDIYLAEIQRDISKVMYPALRDVVIDMPDFYSAGGDGKAAPTSLDVFTTLGAQKMIEDHATKAPPFKQ